MIKELDVQEIPPRKRHPLIFQTFDELAIGDTLEIINDHDPKPLIYQFMHERPQQFAWEYIEQGPEVWRIHIHKEAQNE